MKGARRGAEQGPACGMRPPVARVTADVIDPNLVEISEAGVTLCVTTSGPDLSLRPVGHNGSTYYKGI